jgi:hypothetical protein
MIRLIVLFLFAVPLVMQAQHVFVRGGLSMNKYTTPFPGEKWNPGFTGGIGVEWPVSATLSLQTELNWIQKGFKWKVHEEYSIDGQDEWLVQRRQLEVSYLEIPVLVSYRLPVGKIKASVFGGAYVAYGLSGEFTRDSKSYNALLDEVSTSHSDWDLEFGEWPNKGNDETEGYEVIQNRTDVGMQLGARVEVFRKLMIDVRYSLGFVDMYDHRYDSWVSQDRWHGSKNQTLQFSVAYPIFSFGGAE